MTQRIKKRPDRYDVVMTLCVAVVFGTIYLSITNVLTSYIPTAIILGSIVVQAIVLAYQYGIIKREAKA